MNRTAGQGRRAGRRGVFLLGGGVHRGRFDDRRRLRHRLIVRHGRSTDISGSSFAREVSVATARGLHVDAHLGCLDRLDFPLRCLDPST